MYFKWGSYWHSQNEVQLNVAKSAITSKRGLKAIIRETWTLRGVLHSSDGTIGTLTTQLETLMDAYGFDPITGQVTGAKDFQNATLYQDDQATPTAHQLVTAKSLSGVRVTGFSFADGQGAEYTTYRGYQITLSADFADTTQNLLEFSESVELEGSGEPDVIWIESLEGSPQPQVSAQQTVMRCTQSGSAVGAFGYPPIPAPLIPDFEKKRARRLRFGPVNRVGQSLYEWHVSWQYLFEGPALAAVPNLP